MASSYTTNKDLEKPGNGDYVDTWNVPLNGDMTVVDYALGSSITFNATTGSQTLGSYDHTTKVLDTYSYVPMVITVQGAISANVVYTIPAGIGGRWIIRNTTTDATTGPWTVTFASGGGGTSVTVDRDYISEIYSDGTNIRYTTTRPILPNNSITTAMLQDGSVTYAKLATAAISSAADFRANTANKLLDANGTWGSAAFVTLTDAASIAVDMSTGFNFQVTLGGNRTLANPTNTKVGQSGVIIAIQDGTGGRTLAFDGNYKFANGTAPTISTGANEYNFLFYYVYTSSFILISNVRDVS